MKIVGDLIITNIIVTMGVLLAYAGFEYMSIYCLFGSAVSIMWGFISLTMALLED